MVFLLGADDYGEADVPADAFVVYQVRLFCIAVLLAHLVRMNTHRAAMPKHDAGRH